MNQLIVLLLWQQAKKKSSSCFMLVCRRGAVSSKTYWALNAPSVLRFDWEQACPYSDQAQQTKQGSPNFLCCASGRFQLNKKKKKLLRFLYGPVGQDLY